MPKLAEINSDWECIVDIKELAGTMVRSKFMQHIRNLKKKASSLDSQVKAALELQAVEDDSNQTANEQPA